MDHNLLRDELIRRQGQMRGRDFARRLGISESYWSLIRRGERPLTLAVIERAVREFPDLAPFVASSLLPEQSAAEQAVAKQPRPVTAGRAPGFSRTLRRLLVNGSLAAVLLLGLLVSQGGFGSPTEAIFAAESARAAKNARDRNQDKNQDKNNQDDERDAGECKPPKVLVTNDKGRQRCAQPDDSDTGSSDDGGVVDPARKPPCKPGFTEIVKKGKAKCQRIPRSGGQENENDDPNDDDDQPDPSSGSSSFRPRR